MSTKTIRVQILRTYKKVPRYSISLFLISAIIFKKRRIAMEKNEKLKSVSKRLGVMLLLVIMLVSSQFGSVMAAYNKHSTYSYTTGMWWWKKTHKCTVYVDSGNWFCVWHGNSKVSTGFEYKNNTEIVLSQTSSFSIGSQTVSTLNASLDAEACGIKAGIGGSISKTSSQSWGVSNTSTRTIEKSAPKGYYSYNVCMNEKKIKVTGTAEGTVYLWAPASQPYRAIVYNESNASYSGVTRY